VVILGADGQTKRISVLAGLSDGVHTTVAASGLAEGMAVVTGEPTRERDSGGSLFSRLMPKPRGGRRP
jgi:hypothetical protein